MQESSQRVNMQGGGRIALHRIRPEAPVGLPLIIAHGTISNAATVRTLAGSLAEAGFDCWMLEWGGHGDSEASTPRQNCEYPAFHDLPTAVSTVLSQTGQQRLFWVSHSGGGHMPLMYLARKPEEQSRFAGLVTIGTQSTHCAVRWREKLVLLLLMAGTNLTNRTPQMVLPLGNEPEPTRLLAQWAGWNVTGRWTGADGLDYMAALRQLRLPVKIVAGGRDRAAPVDGCRAIYDAIGSADKTWMLCAESSGFSHDFGHGEMIRGSAAREELFPRIIQWLMQRADVTLPTRP